MASESSGQLPHWLTLVSETVLQKTAFLVDELNNQEAQSRLQTFGPNKLKPTKKKAFWRVSLPSFTIS